MLKTLRACFFPCTANTPCRRAGKWQCSHRTKIRWEVSEVFHLRLRALAPTARSKKKVACIAWFACPHLIRQENARPHFLWSKFFQNCPIRGICIFPKQISIFLSRALGVPVGKTSTNEILPYMLSTRQQVCACM